MAEYASGVNPADFVSAMQQLGGRVQQQVVAAEVLTVTGSTVEIQEKPPELEPTLPGLEDERLVAAEARVRELESQAIQLGTALHFEQLNRIIYRSQWNALVMLSIRGDAGAAEPELQTFLEEHQRAAPLLGQVPNGTIGELLAWPMANSLLTRGNDGKYFITDWGKRFVAFAQTVPVPRLG